MVNMVQFRSIRVWYIRGWIPNPTVLCSKPLGSFKVDTAFHPSKFDKMSTRDFWEVSG